MEISSFPTYLTNSELNTHEFFSYFLPKRGVMEKEAQKRGKYLVTRFISCKVISPKPSILNASQLRTKSQNGLSWKAKTIT